MRRIQEGMSPLDVEAALGVRTIQLDQGNIKLWSYDLWRLGNTRYSFRVAVVDGKVNQVHIGMEAC